MLDRGRDAKCMSLSFELELVMVRVESVRCKMKTRQLFKRKPVMSPVHESVRMQW